MTPTSRTIAELPSVTGHPTRILDLLGGREPAVFLDYDGTLSPIVDDPDAATLPSASREAIVRLAQRCTVAIVSGRDLDDVRRKVGIDGIAYAGSHGFDLLTADGERRQLGTEFLPPLDAATAALERDLASVPGSRIERKGFAVAVHDRQVADDRLAEVAQAVRRAAAGHPDLRLTDGKRVFELRPGIDWDKGRALEWFLHTLGIGEASGTVPVYVGDDVTDEDAFRALEGRGIAVVVRGEDDDRPTLADLSLSGTDDVRELLDLLHDHLAGR